MENLNETARLLCKGPNAKDIWKKIYRDFRVYNRERKQSILDMMIYGSGFMVMPKDGSDPYRVDPRDVVITATKQNMEPGQNRVKS